MSAVDEVVTAVLSDPRPLLLLTDFDGTLCEFQTDPSAVRLPESRRRPLAALSTRPRVTVGLVSGRRLDDLRTRAGLGADVYYAGLHGMEIEGPHGRFTIPNLDHRRDELQQIAALLESTLATLPGTFIENKQLSVALHVRAASADDRARAERVFWTAAAAALDAGRLRLQRGACVFELLPDIAWTKGDAVRWIAADVAQHRGTGVWPVYLGDDRTDEHAFAAVDDTGLSIAVGSRVNGADHRLADPEAVELLLLALAARTETP